MKIYFNTTFIEKERITDDLWVKGNNGNVLQAFFDDLDLSDINVNLRLVIGWSNGETTNEMPMLKSYDKVYAHINLPTLRYDGDTSFTIRVYQNDTLLQTAIFTRKIKASIDASDDTNIDSAEYESMMSQINAVDEKANTNTAYIVDLRELITDLETGGEASNADIILLKSRVKKVEDELAQANEHVNDNTITISENKNRLANIENGYIKSVTYIEETGIFKFVLQDGTIKTIDTAIEKVVANFKYDETSQSLILTLADGTKQKISMSAFIGGGSGVNASNIGNLIGSTWFIKEPFEKDEETWVLNLDFTSNNQEFVQMVYVPEVGLRYITADNQAVDVYAEVNNVVVREYREFTITGGAEVTNRITISIIKNIADYISGGTAKVGVTKEEVQEMIDESIGQALDGEY